MKHLLLLAMLPSFCAFSQNRFSKLLDYNNQYQGAIAVMEAPTGGYLTGSKNIGTEYSDNKLLLHRLDADGNEIWQKEIYTEGFIYYLDFGAMLRLPDGNYLLGGDYKEIATELLDAFMVKIDTSGNVLWMKTYGSATKNDFFGHFALTPDSLHIMISGQTRKTDAAGNIWFVKTDLNGEQEWEKELPGAGWQDSEYMAMLGDGSFFLASFFGTSNQYEYKVYRINASGDVMWQKEVGTNYDDSGFPKVVALPDGSCLFTGSVGTADWRVHLPYAIRVSASGNTVWEKTYPAGFTSRAFAQPIVSNDGTVVLSGGIEYDTFFAPLYVRTWKIDFNGDMLWERVHYGNPAIDNYIYHQIATTDGGIMGVGSAFGSTTLQDIWLLKLDSEGCLEENCLVATEDPEVEPEQDDGGLTFAPNPGSDFVTVTYTLHSTGREAIFTLSDMYGRQVLVQPIPADAGTGQFGINLHDLPVGVYVGVLSVNGQRQAVSWLTVVK
jgi:hypothetical protein